MSEGGLNRALDSIVIIDDDDRTQGFRPMVSSAVWGKAPAARQVQVIQSLKYITLSSTSWAPDPFGLDRVQRPQIYNNPTITFRISRLLRVIDGEHTDGESYNATDHLSAYLLVI